MLILTDSIKLIISALFVLHQYIPSKTGNNKIFSDVRDAKVEDVLPAAHYTCKYLAKNFSSLIPQTSHSDDPALSSEMILNIGFGLMNSDAMKSKLSKSGINNEDLKLTLKILCSDNFRPSAMSPEQKQEIFNFINKYVRVLKNEQLQSFGRFRYFGNIKVVDKNNSPLGIWGDGHRKWTSIKEISKHTIDALLTTEDHNFFKHDGVQTKSIPRIAMEAVTKDQGSGGSTLTMQMLKNAFFKDPKILKKTPFKQRKNNMLLRKVREWYWALPFEKTHSIDGQLYSGKQYVLEHYINLNNFGPGIQGIAQAAKVYFDKKPIDLNIAESAYIALMLKAPSKYSKASNYERFTLPRRNDYVLPRMHKLKYISKKQLETALKEPLPQWERNRRNSLEDFSTNIMRLVNNSVNSFNFPGQPHAKNINVKTTINKKLQKIVFNTTRSKLDSYDRKNDHLKRVRPARDGRSRIAKVEKEDVLWSQQIKFIRLLRKIRTENKVKAHLSVYLGHGQYFHFHPDISDKVLDSYFKSKAQKRKSLYFLAIDCPKVKTLDQPEPEENCIKPYPLDNLSESLKAEISELEKNLSWSLVRNTLRRLEASSSREWLIPAYYDGANIGKPLVLVNGSRISLTRPHLQYFKRKRRARYSPFRPGHYFWVSRVNSKSSTYRLQSPKLQASVIVMDSRSGEVLASFGGYDPNKSYIDRSRHTIRQIGSTIKPWVYLLAATHGVTKHQIITNDINTLTLRHRGVPYRPKNYSAYAPKRVPFWESLATSQNIATVALLENKKWGRGNSANNLEELRNYLDEIRLYRKTKNEPSIVLGSQETSLLRLTSSYTAFANNSYIAIPKYIKSISDEYGNNFKDFPSKSNRLTEESERSLKDIQSILVYAANSGTSSSIKKFTKKLGRKYKRRCFSYGRQTCFGGKTGTTNNNKDVWFIGFSKNFVIGVHVGYDAAESVGGTGGSLAVPIFTEIIKNGKKHLPPIEPLISGKKLLSMKRYMCRRRKVIVGYSNDYEQEALSIYAYDLIEKGTKNVIRSFQYENSEENRRQCENGKTYVYNH